MVHWYHWPFNIYYIYIVIFTLLSGHIFIQYFNFYFKPLMFIIYFYIQHYCVLHLPACIIHTKMQERERKKTWWRETERIFRIEVFLMICLQDNESYLPYQSLEKYIILILYTVYIFTNTYTGYVHVLIKIQGDFYFHSLQIWKIVTMSMHSKILKLKKCPKTFLPYIPDLNVCNNISLK